MGFRTLLPVIIAVIGLMRIVTAQTTAFVDVSVIPMDRERILNHQTVVVTDGIIVGIGDRIKIPKNAVRIDEPREVFDSQFADMHAHLLSDEKLPDALAPDELRVMVANGVTTARLMIGTPEHLELRKRSANGEIAAPTLFVASPQFSGRSFGGNVFNGYVVTNNSQAREFVRKAKSDGYDFIKLTFFITGKSMTRWSTKLKKSAFR